MSTAGSPAHPETHFLLVEKEETRARGGARERDGLGEGTDLGERKRREKKRESCHVKSSAPVDGQCVVRGREKRVGVLL